MSPKDFLDRAASTGLEESLFDNSKLMHNSGPLSDLGGVHSQDPKNPLVKSREFSSYGNKYQGFNTVNPILNKGIDLRNERLKEIHSRREIFRGDELGDVEYYKRKIRRGDPIERPQFDLDERGKVKGHEGRHRSRALLEEGVEEEEVSLFDGSDFERDNPEYIIGERNSLNELQKSTEWRERLDFPVPKTVSKYDSPTRETVTKQVSVKSLREKLDSIKEDTRAPIFGRYSKQRVAELVDKNNIKRRHNVIMNPEHGVTIADAYDAMEHRPNDPDVQAAYKAFNDETLEQFNELRENGLKVTKLKKDQPGYSTAEQMHDDIMNNLHLSYFPSDSGFGTDEKPNEHPMLQGSGIIDDEGKEMPMNDIFRIVHDVNGHNLGDLSDFSAEGEQSAFLTHRQQYSPLAQKALFTETAGQANWGAFNRKSGLNNLRLISQGKHDDIEFAEQKAGLLPDEIVNGKWHGEK